MLGVLGFRQEATEPLPEGEVTVRMEFAADPPKPATGGQVTLPSGGAPTYVDRVAPALATAAIA
jgi:arylsulfatase